jgi:predicted esterase
VKQYLPATAINSWPQGEIQATDFALQYGLKDDLAPPELSTTLEEQLRKKGLDLQVGRHGDYWLLCKPEQQF